MIDEGILSEDRFWKGMDEWYEGIAFSYERFTDHLIVKYLLNKYLNLEYPSGSFSPEQSLGALFKDERTCWQNRGLIEAFSIQLPELIGKELGELVPNASDHEPVREAFVDSLIWREPKAITNATLQYINEHIIKHADSHDQFLDALLTITQNPEHPYNARFLHKHLTKFELADRDAWWSIFLHEQYGQHSSVDRLVEWAWSTEDKSHIGDEPIILCGMALSWFLTAPNRFLRDKSTKALISLLTPRLHILIKLLQEFDEVNDPYVLERLVAVSYGCAMRSTDNSCIAKLADFIYKWQFENGTPMPHILLRDYARGIIELALCRGIKLDIDIRKIRPPYQSEWLNEIPSQEELEKSFGKYREGMSDEEIAGLHLYHSVMGDDFSRYVIGGLDEWSSQRLGEPRKPTKKEIYEEFIRSLTARQRETLETYRKIITNIDFYKRYDEVRRQEVFGRQFTVDELQSVAKNSEQSVLTTLGKKKSEIFCTYIIPYLANPHEDEYRFDSSIARRWILKKVLDLGWTKERFGKFDREIVWRDPGRDAHKPERIGKKYQWIAYHELLARLSDNFHFRGRSWSDEKGEYDGPWQLSYIRDIDPSFLLKESQMERWGPAPNTWWFTPSYSDWESEQDNSSWLQNSQDLPNIPQLILVTKPSDNSKWISLQGHYLWEQPTSPGEERYKKPTRQLWYTIKSYLCKEDKMNDLFEWAKTQTLRERLLPEVNDFYRVFLGEFYWSAAFKYSNYNTWTSEEGEIPGEVLTTAERYQWESSGYDCSIDDSVSIYLPAKFISDIMNLRWNGIEGCLFDDKGNLVAFEPSIRVMGSGALLINQDAFLRFLEHSGYDIIWTIIGEKSIIGNRISAEGRIGYLEISGVCRIRGSELEEVINTRFLP